MDFEEAKREGTKAGLADTRRLQRLTCLNTCRVVITPFTVELEQTTDDYPDTGSGSLYSSGCTGYSTGTGTVYQVVPGTGPYKASRRHVIQ